MKKYGFDLSAVTLDRFRELIQEGYLIPSMRKLRDGIDERFQMITSQGITYVSELGKRISDQKKADAFAQVTGIDTDYMTALRRLVSSYQAKPRKLSEFPDIDYLLMGQLEAEGLKTSKALYEYISSKEPGEVQKRFGLTDAEYQTLKALMEVTQLRYVSPLFATAMVRSGYDSITAVAAADRDRFLSDLKQTNVAEQIYKGNIGDTDVQFLIDDAGFFLETQVSTEKSC